MMVKYFSVTCSTFGDIRDDFGALDDHTGNDYRISRCLAQLAAFVSFSQTKMGAGI